MQISAVIITLNEEQNIGRCLTSLKGVADEIVVLDSFSLDKTESICRQHGVTFLQKNWQGYSESKNFANSQARYDYILSLDADEELSPQLRKSILKIKNTTPADGYYLNRLTNYCGKWIRHCGWYPDRKLRLWNRSKGNWHGMIHEKVVLNGRVETDALKGDLFHYSFPTIGDHIITANNFSKIAAQEEFNDGKRAGIFVHLIINPFFTFLKKFFFQLGFLDGYYGFIICRISAFANFLKYSKLRELNKNES